MYLSILYLLVLCICVSGNQVVIVLENGLDLWVGTGWRRKWGWELFKRNVDLR